MKTKSEERERGRFLKGRKLCIANKRIGRQLEEGTPPLREVICEFQGEIRWMSLRPSPPPPLHAWLPVSCMRHGSL